MFDAVFVPSGAKAAKAASDDQAVHWIREAFGHI